MSSIEQLLCNLHKKDPRAVARAISTVENNNENASLLLEGIDHRAFDQALVLGITGSPGVGKSTLTSSLIRLLRSRKQRVGVIAIDPSSPLSGGALLGDRIRMMGHSLDPDVVMRSMATRGRLGGLCASAGAAARIMAASGCSVIIIETVGVGQSEMDIVRLADITLMVLAPGQGDEIQAMKAGLLEVADILVVNKIDCPGAEALTMDLESAARHGFSGQKRICQTEATSGTGVSELADALDELGDSYRLSGERQRRRKSSHDMEVLDWAVEMLKPLLAEKLKTRTEEITRDPQQTARKIVSEFTGIRTPHKK